MPWLIPNFGQSEPVTGYLTSREVDYSSLEALGAHILNVVSRPDLARAHRSFRPEVTVLSESGNGILWRGSSVPDRSRGDISIFIEFRLVPVCFSNTLNVVPLRGDHSTGFFRSDENMTITGLQHIHLRLSLWLWLQPASSLFRTGIIGDSDRTIYIENR